MEEFVTLKFSGIASVDGRKFVEYKDKDYSLRIPYSEYVIRGKPAELEYIPYPTFWW